MPTKAIYAGSFDPVTHGHGHVILESIKLFDELIVAVGENPAKKGKSLFTLPERVLMLDELTEGYRTRVQVVSFTDIFLVDLAVKLECTHIVRGIRNARDFEEELAMAQINHDLGTSRVRNLTKNPSTVFIPTPSKLALISSSMVKSMIGFGGWENEIVRYLPIQVAKAVKKKVNGKAE